jgi:hypothetical protein
MGWKKSNRIAASYQSVERFCHSNAREMTDSHASQNEQTSAGKLKAS